MDTPLRTLIIAGLIAAATATTAAAQDAHILTVRQGAAAQQVVQDPGQPVVEVIPVDPGPVHVIIEDQQQDPNDVEPCCPLPVEPVDPPRPDRRGPLASMSLFVDSLSLSMGRNIENPEIHALAGRQLPMDSGRIHATAGGVMFSSGYRPRPWLRAPELRLYLGGGSVHGAEWAPVEGADGFEMRADSIFVVRFDMVIGFQPRIGDSFRPFILGRVGYAGYALKADTRHRDLGVLGEEKIREGMFEVGVDAGFAVHLTDHWQMSLAYRGTWGPESQGHGAMLSFLVGEN